MEGRSCVEALKKRLGLRLGNEIKDKIDEESRLISRSGLGFLSLSIILPGIEEL